MIFHETKPKQVSKKTTRKAFERHRKCNRLVLKTHHCLGLMFLKMSNIPLQITNIPYRFSGGREPTKTNCTTFNIARYMD